jgi:hypothetical protein
MEAAAEAVSSSKLLVPRRPLALPSLRPFSPPFDTPLGSATPNSLYNLSPFSFI